MSTEAFSQCRGGQSCSATVGSRSGLSSLKPLQEEVVVQFATGHDVCIRSTSNCCHACCGKLIAFLRNKLGYWSVTRLFLLAKGRQRQTSTCMCVCVCVCVKKNSLMGVLLIKPQDMYIVMHVRVFVCVCHCVFVCVFVSLCSWPRHEWADLTISTRGFHVVPPHGWQVAHTHRHTGP